MIRIRVVVFICAVALMIFAFISPSAAQGGGAQSGHTNWKRWSFDWEIKDYTGIAIRNVYFNNELVLYKGNMPVIRVEYFNCNGCGPYADQLGWYSLLNMSNCNNQIVCQRSFVYNGKEWLELSILAGIGKYRIYEVWYFNDDGVINPQLHSRGLHHIADHKHHVYWRFDFDINGASGDQIFVFDNNRPNQGWGNGWHLYGNELNDTKSPGTARVWFVRDNATAHGMWVFPGGADGVIDGFSTKDMGGRRYHSAEDTGWTFGATGHLGYLDGESLQQQDDIFWYVAHMYHAAAEGEYLWHAAGPVLLVER